MHRRQGRRTGATFLCTVAMVASLFCAGTVRADDLTPQVDVSPTAQVATTPEVVPTDTPLPTLPPIPTLPPPSATPLPTVAEESGTPLATVRVPVPVATEPPPTAAATDVMPTRVAHVGATPTVLPGTAATVVATSPAPIEAPLPSPAQLEASARLQFGHGVPHAVRQWAFIIVPTAKKYGLDPMLVAAVITMESGGDPLAWNSGSDARGLMQVLHGPWDPRQNIETGVKMLAAFHDEFPDWNLTLAAYNAGPNAVLTYGGVPPYRETRDYVIVVSYLWDLYGNHRLTVHRKVQYRSTLKDLTHFKDQRKKVKELATAGGVRSDFSLSCAGSACASPGSGAAIGLPSLDPFWPIASAPDPLQQVDPLSHDGR